MITINYPGVVTGGYIPDASKGQAVAEHMRLVDEFALSAQDVRSGLPEDRMNQRRAAVLASARKLAGL